ncbi:MAG: hypothetical protein COT25_01420 [Candidatus Kerfeldbacteria bacterium CG08_land_8_20_14_0_20_42_7]|uniref:Phospholipid/glycerol acyltransferase domain-containing protein n=1 Tax=Candidatus Kerfeldbacteria bacterium CG08_land_8_20_14_0_20_42_7 TaxID=2014245 RepID=A0A2H0YTC5_9BACT|nr:MAG: hypothetical protein COT25_01420 [Candidatus Kerfeldbacteria bacterium CG08_land_8_20_14_0_20_42_7]
MCMFIKKILHRFGAWISYVLVVMAIFVCFLFFQFPINFARVKGRKNIPRKGNNILFVANHDTMFDSFFIGICAFFFRVIFYPSEPFVNFADQKNYFTTWYVKCLLKMLRTEPVARRDQAMLMKRYVQLLKKRNLLIFYQGTRSKDLTLIKDGPAFAIRNAKPTPIVVPVFHEGMDRIFSRGGPKTHGIWRWLPRSLFRRPTIVFGKPIDFTDLLTIDDSRKATDAINTRIVREIQLLKEFLSTTNAVS